MKKSAKKLAREVLKKIGRKHAYRLAARGNKTGGSGSTAEASGCTDQGSGGSDPGMDRSPQTRIRASAPIETQKKKPESMERRPSEEELRRDLAELSRRMSQPMNRKKTQPKPEKQIRESAEAMIRPEILPEYQDPQLMPEDPPEPDAGYYDREDWDEWER